MCIRDRVSAKALKASNSVGKNSMKLWATVPTALTSEPNFISARPVSYTHLIEHHADEVKPPQLVQQMIAERLLLFQIC